MSYIVNFFGGPGSGKSTISARVFYELKLRGINAEIVTEFARELVYEGRNDLLDQQIILLAEQYRRIQRVYEQTDFVIVDSPLHLSSIYAKNYPSSFNDLVDYLNNQFNNINVYLPLNRPIPENDEGRVHDNDEAINIDQKIYNLLAEKNGNSFIPINNDRDIMLLVDMLVQIERGK